MQDLIYTVLKTSSEGPRGKSCEGRLRTYLGYQVGMSTGHQIRMSSGHAHLIYDISCEHAYSSCCDSTGFFFRKLKAGDGFSD